MWFFQDKAVRIGPGGVCIVCQLIRTEVGEEGQENGKKVVTPDSIDKKNGKRNERREGKNEWMRKKK